MSKTLLCITLSLSIWLKCKLNCSAREIISVISWPKACYFYNVCTVYRSNVLALYSFYSPEPKCITQSEMQRSQINFAKEPNLAPEPQKWATLIYSVIKKLTPPILCLNWCKSSFHHAKHRGTFWRRCLVFVIFQLWRSNYIEKWNYICLGSNNNLQRTLQ